MRSAAASMGNGPAVYEHAMACNDAYAGLLAHLEIAFNGMPRFMILGMPATTRLRDLTKRPHHNPHPDPDKGSHRYFASAAFEIDHRQIECSHEIASGRVHTASLNAGEPVDLSAVDPPDVQEHSQSTKEEHCPWPSRAWMHLP